MAECRALAALAPALHSNSGERMLQGHKKNAASRTRVLIEFALKLKIAVQAAIAQ
jgi:hypothetical protein